MLKIISGGQTGVDRGALDAAREFGAEYGGWIPRGRLAEDGTIPKSYRLQEMPTEEYAARTKQNVEDSDGTLIISKGEPTGGTRATVKFCRELGKAHLIIDVGQLSLEEAIERATNFVQEFKSPRKSPDRGRDPSTSLGMTILNVAGPRASQWPEGYDLAKRIVAAVLRA